MKQIETIQLRLTLAAIYESFHGCTQRRRVYWATSPLTGWKVVRKISEDEILVPVRELTLRSTLVDVACLVVLVLIVSIIAR